MKKLNEEKNRRNKLKILWQLHWCINIAPYFNGQSGKNKVYHVDNWGLKVNETHPYYGGIIKKYGIEYVLRRNCFDKIVKQSPTSEKKEFFNTVLLREKYLKRLERLYMN